jgi:hypothetical protein
VPGRLDGRDRRGREKKVEEWQAKGVDIEYVHRTDRTGYKAGALDNGLKTAKGDFVALFDADFVPQPDFLQKSIHHFTDDKIGCVQARWGHINKEYSFLTRLQSIFLDGHMMMEHAARNRGGRFFNFSGTAGMWRKTTIADAGGWQHDTLTEDLDLSFRAQLKGWKFIFLPWVVTPAELPVDMNGFKSQQHRWVKGSMQTSKKLLGDVLQARIPLHVKTEAALHLTGNTAYILTLLLTLMLFPVTYFRPKLDMKTSVLLDLAVFALATLSVCVFYLASQREIYGWRGVVRTIFYTPFLLAMGNRDVPVERPRGRRGLLHPRRRVRPDPQVRPPGEPRQLREQEVQGDAQEVPALHRARHRHRLRLGDLLLLPERHVRRDPLPDALLHRLPLRGVPVPLPGEADVPIIRHRDVDSGSSCCNTP